MIIFNFSKNKYGKYKIKNASHIHFNNVLQKLVGIANPYKNIEIAIVFE